MWRTPLSVLLAATLGSLIATGLMSIWLGDNLTDADALRIALAIALVTMFFTLPGAMLLAGMELVLIERGTRPAVVDLSLIAIGGVAGASILGLMSSGFALGAFYGSITALIFLCFQHLLGSRLAKRG